MRREPAIIGVFAAGMIKSVISKVLPFAVVVVLLGAGCAAHKSYYKNAANAFDRGDYDAAVYMNVEALKIKPDFTEAASSLRNAAAIAQEIHLKNAKKYEEAGEFDAAVNEYRTIDKLNSAIAAVRADIALENITDRKHKASLSAAKAHYNRGLKLLEDGETKRNNNKLKEAAVEFRTAVDFIPDYRDSKSLYERARKGAIVRVAVLPFRDNAYPYIYGDMLTEEVLSKSMRQQPEFLEFVTRENLREIEKEKVFGVAGIIDPATAIEAGKVLGVQYVMAGKVLSATVDTPKRIDAKGSKSCNIRIKKDQYRPGSVAWTTYELKATAVIGASFQIIEVKTGKIMLADIAKAEETDLARWKEFKGDEDCLPWEVRNFSNGKTTVDSGPVLLGKAFEKASEEIAEKLIERFR